MTTINISLPNKLKEEAENLVKSGLYVSFSDLVRDSLRKTVKMNKYDLWYEEAKKDEKSGKATILKSKEDMDKFFKSF